jgi:hypothetical protein
MPYFLSSTFCFLLLGSSFPLLHHLHTISHLHATLALHVLRHLHALLLVVYLALGVFISFLSLTVLAMFAVLALLTLAAKSVSNSILSILLLETVDICRVVIHHAIHDPTSVRVATRAKTVRPS